MTKTLQQLDELAHACMESNEPGVEDRHRRAGARQGEQSTYAASEEARELVAAVSLHDCLTGGHQLTAAELLFAAAIIAARANDEELPAAPAPEAAAIIAAGDELATILEHALLVHFYEDQEPEDCPERLALNDWEKAKATRATELARDVAEAGEQLTEALGNPLPVPALITLRHSADLGGYDEPKPLPERRWRVRFYKEEMTVDRYSITVAADSPSEARARVKAWGNGELELTQEEEESEHYDRQVDTRACEFSSLEEEDDPYAVAEVDHAGRQLA